MTEVVVTEVVVTEAGQAIDSLKRKVMWRARMIALQDYAAIILTAGGTVAAAIALYIKLKPLQTAWWPVASAAFAVIAVALLARWYKTAATERYAAFKIDQALELEDRITTTQTITERGGPKSPIEIALVEDAANHIAEAKEATIVPYRVAGWHALSLLGVAALVTALAIPQRALPGGEQLIAERANIENAGDRLEQTSAEIEQAAPAETETRNLAREQSDLGRALRRTQLTQAEALKKLSALEERIRERHDELASTRADEIVSLAEKRFEPALAPKPKESQKQSATAGQSEINQSRSGNESKPAQKDGPETSEPRAESKDLAAGKQSSGKQTSGKQTSGKEISSEQKKTETNPATNPAAGNQQIAADRKPPAEGAAQKTGEQNKTQPQSEARSEKQQPQPASSEAQSVEQQRAAEQQKTEAEKNPPGSLAGSLAEQAAKALPESMVEQAAKAATPMLSDQLLKQAEQLRANQLTPEDIRRLRQAAESLAKDLAPIAQSKEFQQTVEQLARQINPEQLERVARELMSQENIRRELESAARLLMENREAKEIITGLAEIARSQSRSNQQTDPGSNQDQPQTTGPDGESKSRGDGPGARDGQPNGRGEGRNEGRGEARNRQERNPGEVKLSAQGKEVKQGGTIQRKPGGEYLYLESKPGAGAARAPYSSAYPQYRREAERSVERSQVPQHLRSVVRKYFDAINPDIKRKE